MAVAVMSLLPFITREYFSPHPQTQKRVMPTAAAVPVGFLARLWTVGCYDDRHQRRVRNGGCGDVAIAFHNAR
ncbi:MAG: hypothetical protein IIV82_01305, partial [Ruminococcus sp.]|nr:hypothetical protein [Ruminococcus sp.]